MKNKKRYNVIIVRTNAFQVEHDYMKAVVRLIRIDKIIEIDKNDQGTDGKAIYPTFSFLSHSCSANGR